jgi:outer membrane autotransporter protein
MLPSLKILTTKINGNKSCLKPNQGLLLQDSAGCLRLSFSLLGIISTTTLMWQPHLVNAQTFDQASNKELGSICGGFVSPGMGTELINICKRLVGGGADGGLGNASSGVGTQSQPNAILISQQQLKDAQTKKEGKDMPQGGSSGDSIIANWGKFSTFLTAGATALRHRQNDFEQGYTSTIPSVTLGGGYRIFHNLETGLAFNYSNSKADNNTGGGFNVDSYSPLLYINYLPFDHAFTSLVIGYTRQNQTNNRVAVAGKDPSSNLVSTNTKGNLNANQYSLNFLSGYDHPVENLTIGPRFGVDVRQWEMNGYQETTNTGLELRYNSQNQTSIQSTLGLAASFAHNTPYGVLVPQLSASWVHEYANNSRTINAHFVQAPGSTAGFFFQTENPARNWAVINLSVSFLMQKGVQVFANLSTVQGNRNFESYGGNVGVRVGW